MFIIIHMSVSKSFFLSRSCSTSPNMRSKEYLLIRRATFSSTSRTYKDTLSNCRDTLHEVLVLMRLLPLLANWRLVLERQDQF